MDYSELSIFAESDVVVCGGGTAGAFAAKSAADMGRDVLIVEQFGSLGGTATNGLVMPIMHTYIDRNPQCSYISNIVRDKLLSLGAGNENGNFFDPLMMKVVLEELCLSSNVRMLFHTFIVDTVVDDGKIKYLVVANKRGLGLVKGKVFIDATGDADVAVRTGAGFTQGNPKNGKNQPISLRYIVANVDFDEFGRFIWETNKKTGKYLGASYENGEIYVACCNGDDWAFSEIFSRAVENGDLLPEDRAYWQGFTVTGRKGALAFNCPEIFVSTDGTNPDHLTKAQVEGKQRIINQLKFCKKYLRGFDNAYISDIATMVGIRESRNVVCEYMLTGADLLSKRKFDGAICQSNYPVDVHGGVLEADVEIKPICDGKPWYEIPFGSLVVKGFDNFLVAGRCIGAEFLAQSSLRVQQSARATGEAAGIGAALALGRGVLPREISGAEVRGIMISNGAYFL